MFPFHTFADAATGATTVLFQYGIAGVAIFGLTMAVVVLYRDNQKLHEVINTLQDQRRADAVGSFEKVNELSTNFSQTSTLLASKIEVAKKG